MPKNRRKKGKPVTVKLGPTPMVSSDIRTLDGLVPHYIKVKGKPRFVDKKDIHYNVVYVKNNGHYLIVYAFTQITYTKLNPEFYGPPVIDRNWKPVEEEASVITLADYKKKRVQRPMAKIDELEAPSEDWEEMTKKEKKKVKVRFNEATPQVKEIEFQNFIAWWQKTMVAEGYWYIHIMAGCVTTLHVKHKGVFLEGKMGKDQLVEALKTAGVPSDFNYQIVY